MELVIKELDEINMKDVGQCDDEFVIDSQLVLHVEHNQIRYSLIDQPPTKKRYDQGEVDYATYLDNPERIVFLAYIGGTVAGQIVLRKNWNNYAYIDYVAIDVGFRGLGIGQALMAQAKKWTQEKYLPGIMAETQTNNVRACQFYERCGFRIGGFDNYLYKGIEAETEEVAVFWYFHFEEEARLAIEIGRWYFTKSIS